MANRALVYLNGKISGPEEAKVSVFDRGFLFGDGVYEVGRSYDRCFLFLEEHWARLRHSASCLGIPVPINDRELSETLFKVAKAFGDENVYFRTILTRGVVNAVSLDVQSVEPTCLHIVHELPKNLSHLHEFGIKLLTSTTQRNSSRAQDPNIKTSNYLNSLLALKDVRERGGEDAILCDPQGNVTEGTTFSIFGVTEDDSLITPALQVGILDSITRRHVLKLAKGHFKINEGFFKLDDFYRCKEVFISSSIREVAPVSKLDVMEYNVPGKVTTLLHESYRNEIRQYLKTNSKF